MAQFWAPICTFLQELTGSRASGLPPRVGPLRGLVTALILIALSLVGLSGEAAGFKDVPSYCQRVLTRILPEDDGRVIDWSGLQNHLYQLGYSQQVSVETLEYIHFTTSNIERLFREALEDETWVFSGSIGKDEMSKLANHRLDRESFLHSLTWLPYLSEVPGFSAAEYVEGQ